MQLFIVFGHFPFTKKFYFLTVCKIKIKIVSKRVFVTFKVLFKLVNRLWLPARIENIESGFQERKVTLFY